MSSARGLNTTLSSGEKILRVDAQLSVKYLSVVVGAKRQPCPVFLLMHGYSQTAEYLLNKFLPTIPDGALVIAANGPFPAPKWIDEKPRLGFSWYFYDSSKDEYLVDMKTSVDMWIKIVDENHLQEVPKIIIGYSQGGYLAPFVAQELKNVVQVVGVGCEFLADELKENLSFRIDGIHGENDEVVSHDGAKKSHEKLIAQGARGNFITVKGNGHKISDEITVAVKNKIQLI
jgi:predicted esterase